MLDPLPFESLVFLFLFGGTSRLVSHFALLHGSRVLAVERGQCRNDGMLRGHKSTKECRLVTPLLRFLNAKCAWQSVAMKTSCLFRVVWSKNGKQLRRIARNLILSLATLIWQGVSNR
jgi:hypothetical protein